MRTFVSVANFFKASLTVLYFESNIIPEVRSHKRGRSLDKQLFSKSEERFIAASEVQRQATSDSVYDSDVIVMGKG
jgi:hypothetical protein